MPSSPYERILRLAISVNNAWDNKNEKLLINLISEASTLYDGTLSDSLKANISFSRANAHSALRQIRAEENQQLAWSWNNFDLQHAIYWLRTALIHASSSQEESELGDLRPRILTNLANAMSHTGRFCEAAEHWDKAISENPNFAMALANRGDGLKWYARALYDGGHQTIFLWQSRNYLSAGLSSGLEAHAIPHVRSAIKHLDAIRDWKSFTFELEDYPIGTTDSEQRYRKWCLKNWLFLNPLNDLGSYNIAACDVITFPSISLPIKSGDPLVPEVYGIYNQLVQEFVSARYLTYEALTDRNKGLAHFSDQDVALYDTLDYRILRLWVEKIKMAYLSAFAIFDKIAYLLNHYLELGIPTNRVNFGSLWFNSCSPKKGIRHNLEGAENWPLRGLFGVSRDLHWISNETFSMEPEAKKLHEIRKHIAHKYLTVHDSSFTGAGAARKSSVSSEISYAVSGEELMTATIKLLKLVRSAMIYLSLSANWHENTKSLHKEIPCAPMQLYPLGNNRP